MEVRIKGYILELGLSSKLVPCWLQELVPNDKLPDDFLRSIKNCDYASVRLFKITYIFTFVKKEVKYNYA